jgi:hypothetical protein
MFNKGSAKMYEEKQDSEFEKAGKKWMESQKSKEPKEEE